MKICGCSGLLVLMFVRRGGCAGFARRILLGRLRRRRGFRVGAAGSAADPFVVAGCGGAGIPRRSLCRRAPYYFSTEGIGFPEPRSVIHLFCNCAFRGLRSGTLGGRVQ